MNFAWIKARVVELTVAVCLAVMVIQLSNLVTDRQRSAVPASSWMRINEVFVPDFRVGQDPVLIYDRTVLEPSDGFWIVEVQRQTVSGLWTTACSGAGIETFSPNEIIENNTVTWGWYIGEPCEVAIGRYRLRTTYTLTRPGWPAKRLFNLSNVFNVRA